MIDPDVAVVSAQPYPPIEVTEQNRRYVSILLQDISSAKGEMTAVCQYLYLHWCFDKMNSNLSILLKRIAAVEMHHIDILGKLVVLLGGNPICRTNPCNCNSAWNGNMLQYNTNIKQALTHSISSELSAVNDYTAQAESIQDPLLSAVLTRIAKDEEVHYHIFRSLLEQENKNYK